MEVSMRRYEYRGFTVRVSSSGSEVFRDGISYGWTRSTKRGETRKLIDSLFP